MRFVAMIPARLGSTRVKKKNLRMLGDKPLIAHIVETAVASGAFDEVYINSESRVFAPVAERYGAKFYQRPAHLATDTATNDDFALDFMEKVPSDIFVQLNPTSPFTSVDDIRRAKDMFIKDGYDSVLAVEERKIEGVFRGQPLNWNPLGQMPPSQQLEPILLFSNGILAYRTSVYKQNMKERGCAVYGGAGKTGYLVVRGNSVVDIDNEDDFAIAETILAAGKAGKAPPRYWDELPKDGLHSETLVSSILKKDGVAENDLEDVNHELTNIPRLLASLPTDTSWSKRIINSPSNCVTLIGQMPGEGNRRHYHFDWDEWWFILEGEWEWEVEGAKKTVREGDVVFIERNRVHKITAKGSTRAVRMAVSRDNVAHVYTGDVMQFAKLAAR
jgi:CMP-N-acetylneuraminic acid synthetase/quercetin dioxygenase-like cupin family protein